MVKEPLDWKHYGQALELEATLPPQAVAGITMDV
jgi:hypothetical protein